jgi:predicted DsbA family dithiol-disulfide isomerase
MRTYNAHQALEYAKSVGQGDSFAETLYRAYWERGEEINSIDVLLRLGGGTLDDLPAYESAIRERRFRDNVVGFDDPAHEKGVYNVPTFFIGGERYAEQPYTVLAAAASKLLAPAH